MSQEKEYASLFEGGGARGDSEKELYMVAKTGRLRSSHIRSLCWRVFLGVFPRGAMSAQEWLESQHARRSEYDSLCDRFLVDPHKESDGADPLVNNPLAQAENSAWTKYFELKQLQKDITQDLERLNPDDEYYRQADVQKHMLRVLSVWACLHPVISYRQGMHEVLAPIIKVLESDMSALEADRGKAHSEQGKALAGLLQRQYMEHDAYALFTALMDIIGDAFAPPTPAVKGGPPPKPSGVLLRCNRVHQTLLRTSDEALYQHLEALGVEPQLFAMRWIRLLLGREFHIEDVLVLWDALFADHHERHGGGAEEGAGLELIEYLCVAMLMYVRADLLLRDNTGCLRRLMKYPPVENVSLLVTRACALRDPAAPPPMPQTPTCSEPSTSTQNTPAPPTPADRPLATTPMERKEREGKGLGTGRRVARWAAAVRGAADVLADLLPGAADPRHVCASEALKTLDVVCKELKAEQEDGEDKGADASSTPLQDMRREPRPSHRAADATSSSEQASSAASKPEPVPLRNGVSAPRDGIVGKEDEDGGEGGIKMASWVATSMPESAGVSSTPVDAAAARAAQEEREREANEAARRRKAALGVLLNEPESPATKSEGPVHEGLRVGAGLDAGSKGDTLFKESKGDTLFRGGSLKKKSAEVSLFGEPDVSSWLTPKR